jgi:twitching motility protein PilT
MINYINENLDRHIVTVEHPIEYYHQHKKSIVNQREVGVDVPSFAEALRRVLRQDPDVVLIGELRDLETMENALRAAETGHLVFSTVHTTGCQGTITRIVDTFPVAQQEQIRVQMSTNLIAVLSQALCPLKTGKGRVAAYEFMVVTPAIANLIRENKTYRIESSIQTGRNLGMQLLDDHLWQLYDDDKITLEEMLDKARQPSAMLEKAEKKAGGRTDEMRKELENIGPIIGAST